MRVTEISGRGVGMDVVRRNLEALGGSISTHSERGRGTLFRLKLPLTVAVLEEAGGPEEMVTHLRSPGPHVRGCLAVDLCLGLS